MTSTIVYTTTTPKAAPREHMIVVEMENDLGYRWWSGSMKESKTDSYIESYYGFIGYSVSDVDHAGNCWCGGTVNIWED